MKKPCKYLRFYSLFLLLLLASHISAEVTSSYNSSTNTLRFYGSGVLTKDIVNGTGHQNEAINVKIDFGVTEIGNEAFRDLTNIQTLDLTTATDLEIIGVRAFSGTGLTSITEINYEHLTTIGVAAFEYTALTSIRIPSSVQSIGNYAFYSAPLKSIVLDESTETLEFGIYVFSANEQYRHGVVEIFEAYRPFTCSNSPGLFQYETNLKSVTLINVNSIPRNTFNDCDNLTNLTIGKGLAEATYTANDNLSDIFPKLQKLTICDAESIGTYAFYGSPNLTSVFIPATVSSISEHAFDNCPKVTSMDFYAQSFDLWWNTLQPFANSITDLLIPNDIVADHAWTRNDNLSTRFPNVTNARFGALAYHLHDLIFCVGDGQPTNKLKTVTFENNVSVGWSAFCNNTQLESVELEKVGTFGVTCFKNCNKLTDLDLKASKEIKSNAFIGCTGLTSVKLGRSLTTLASDAFAGCTNLRSLTIENDNILNKVFTSSEPFCNMFPNVKQLTLGYYLTQVGEYAFYGSPLQEVTFVGTNTAVGKEAFSNSLSLTTINGSVKSVDEGSFQNTGINSIKITDDDTIDKNAFNNCWQLTSVELPANLSSINPYAFFGCSSLSDIMLPARLTAIGEKAFASCTSLAEITIPQGLGLNKMWPDSFERCASLKIVNIESYSFAAYNGQPTDNLGTRFPYAANVNFGSNVIYLGNYAFYCHQNLEMVTFASTCTLRESCFEDCVKLKTIEGTIYPSYEGCLAGCTQLTDGFAITGTIGARAFQNCSSLTCIELPARTTTIHANAFDGCSGLTKVICNQTIPVTLTNEMNVFANVPVSKVELDVPYSAILKYKVAEVWKDFGDKFAIGGIKLQDGVAYTNKEDQEVPMIRYTRTFSSTQAGKWQALYIPFGFNAEDYADDFDVAKIFTICPTKDTNGDGTIDADDEKKMILAYVKSGKIYPNTPYMIRPKKAATVSIQEEGTTLYKADINSVSFSTSSSDYSITGLYSPFTATPGDHNYYVTSSGSLSYANTKNVNINPNRWILHEDVKNYSNYEGSEDALCKPIGIYVIGEEIDEETAIRYVNGDFDASQSLDRAIYNINGVKVSDGMKLPHGIYIKNGKKYVK